MSDRRPKAKSEPAEDPELQYKVDYSLDIVTHDLIQSGQISAGKSYALKSPEMKAHMGRQVKSLNRRKYSLDANETPSNNQIIFKPLSLPIGIVTKLKAENGPENKKILSNKASVSPSAGQVKKIGLPSHNNRSSISKAPVIISHSKTVQLSTNHHQNVPQKSKKVLQSVTASSNSTAAIQEAFTAKVDLKEFTNDEISLDVQAHTVTITAYRPRKGPNNSRKVTEVVQVPSHVEMERLRIGRRQDGALIIEEYLQH